MESTILAAERVFSRLQDSELAKRNVGLYLKSSEYSTVVPEDLVQNMDDEHTFARLLEAALADDDATLFQQLCYEQSSEKFLTVFNDYFGLSAFFVYSAACCLSFYLDIQLKDYDAWSDICNEYLFDAIEEEMWEWSWTPAYRSQELAILYLLHYKGGISATSLLKKCIIHGFSAFYAPLVAIGARFEVDDLYLADYSLTSLRTLLSEGLLDVLKVSATGEDWAHLTETFMDLTYPEEEASDEEPSDVEE